MTFVVAMLMLCGLAAAAPNRCTNGSFEELSPGGFPVDWAPLGKVAVSADAHTAGVRFAWFGRLPTNGPPRPVLTGTA
jgi:hypothetical protein